MSTTSPSFVEQPPLVALSWCRQVSRSLRNFLKKSEFGFSSGISLVVEVSADADVKLGIRSEICLVMEVSADIKLGISSEISLVKVSADVKL